LLELCQDEGVDPFERWAAAEALAATGADASKSVPALTALLKNERTAVLVQIGAVNALAALDPPTKETLELLKSVKMERPRAVRLAALGAGARRTRQVVESTRSSRPPLPDRPRRRRPRRQNKWCQVFGAFNAALTPFSPGIMQ
jgi:hypothetical protein